eukprot:Gb_28564 [translate_table: standard]
MAYKRYILSSLIVVIGLALLIGGVLADVPYQSFDWTVTYSNAAPLGVAKQVIVINNQFPGPELDTVTNNIISVNVHNYLDEPFLITWNGIQQRRTSWQDGVQGTNCPIPPGQNWTYVFQVKDQIGSFFYYPSMLLQRAAGGYGGIRIQNRDVIALPFAPPADDFTFLIADWYNKDHRVCDSNLRHSVYKIAIFPGCNATNFIDFIQDLRTSLDAGVLLGQPDGVIINGRGPYQTTFIVQPGATYRFRISNVGIQTTLNFRIQNHRMFLVETEGSYTLQDYHETLDIHVGQSYSVLVTADQSPGAFYIVASSRFFEPVTAGIALLQYANSAAPASGPLPEGPDPMDYDYSINQARAIRWNLTAGAARPNPQGSFHYGLINVTRTIQLQNTAPIITGKQRFAVNDVSFIYPDTPLKLADYFQINNVFTLGGIPDSPVGNFPPGYGTPVIDALNRAFVHIVFQNTENVLQSWHVDGYAFFVVGMDAGVWDASKQSTYNMIDAVSRSTTQVYPNSWTAIMLELDNMGMWNIRSEDGGRQYLGQELYMRVIGSEDSSLSEAPLPYNVLLCGRARATP